MKTRLSILLMVLFVCCVQSVKAENTKKATSDEKVANKVSGCSCASSEDVKKKLEEYVTAARSRLDPKDVDTLSRFDQGVKSFQAYSDIMCRAIYSKWLKEEKRFKFYYCCQERLAQQHAMELWLDFIRYSDIIKPPLPKPAIHECDDE